MKAQIAELESKVKTPPAVTAAELIKMIEGAESVAEVDELIGDDTRVSVTKAAVKKKLELEKAK